MDLKNELSTGLCRTPRTVLAFSSILEGPESESRQLSSHPGLHVHAVKDFIRDIAASCLILRERVDWEARGTRARALKINGTA